MDSLFKKSRKEGKKREYINVECTAICLSSLPQPLSAYEDVYYSLFNVILSQEKWKFWSISLGFAVNPYAVPMLNANMGAFNWYVESQKLHNLCCHLFMYMYFILF